MNDEPQNEQPQAEILPPHRRTGWPKGKARKLKPRPAPEKDSEFAGMTSGESWNSHCADACTERKNGKGGCVITMAGSGNCGHQDKGGLQAADLLRPKCVEADKRARKYLAHLKIDTR